MHFGTNRFLIKYTTSCKLSVTFALQRTV